MENKKTDKLDKWLEKNTNHKTGKTQKTVGFFKHSKQFLGKKSKVDKSPVLKKDTSFKDKKVLRIIPLGGLNEVGQNMMSFEYGDDMVIIDMGFQFPEEDMLGVDYVLPDYTYVEENRHKLRGVIITHGHLDHIGAIPYISPKLDNPSFYGTKLTMGLVTKRMEEFGLDKVAKLNVIVPEDTLKLGCFTVKFFRVTHSIPDCVGVVLETPVGTIVHTGDFKFDFTPADGVLADIDKMAEIGKKGVLALFSDSTNATKPGHTMSESVVGETLDRIIGETPKRLVIASFASLIGRMQQIFNSAQKHKRTIFISGRSMVSNVEMAKKLGYLKYPANLVKELRGNSKSAQRDDALILTTGSQGETLAGLTRMAMDEHRDVKLRPSDTVVFSSSPIMGNERAVIAVTNELTRKGIRVINNKIMDVHTSGHGQQEDLKMMLSLIKPTFFIPVHGEYYMRHAHGELAKGVGVDPKNIVIVDNGDVIEALPHKVQKSRETVDHKYIIVDGKGIADLGAKVISERQSMSQNGTVMITLLLNKKGMLVSEPRFETRGFVYMGEEEHIIKELDKEAKRALKNALTKKTKTKKDIEIYLKRSLDRKIMDMIERRPLIIPVVIVV